MSLHISLCWAEASWLVLLLVSNWVSGVFFLRPSSVPIADNSDIDTKQSDLARYVRDD